MTSSSRKKILRKKNLKRRKVLALSIPRVEITKTYQSEVH